MATTRAFCELPFNKLFVGADGSAKMCCYQATSLGNVLDWDFSDAWEGPLANEIRLLTEAGKLHPACTGWGACPYLVQERIPHSFDYEPAFPTTLEISIGSEHCNVGGAEPTTETACLMCPRSAPGFKPRPDRSIDIARNLAFLMPRLRWLTVLGVAEPLWKGRLFEVLNTLGFQEYREQCVFTTFSNGTLFNSAIRSQFIDTCPRAMLHISIDAATPQTYRRIRRLNAFETVVENASAFAREKRPGQQLRIANNLNLLNLGEAVEMVDLAKRIGADELTFNPTHDGGEKRTDLSEITVGADNYLRFAEAQEKILERSKEIGMAVEFLRPLALTWNKAR